MLYLCVNTQDYRTTKKLHAIKFRKTNSIWNQSFQKIVKVRSKRFNKDGEKLLQKYEDIDQNKR